MSSLTPNNRPKSGLKSFSFSDWMVVVLVLATLVFLFSRLYMRWTHARVHFTVNPIHIGTDLANFDKAKTPLSKIVKTLQMNEPSTLNPETVEKISEQIQKAKNEATNPVVSTNPTETAVPNATVVWWQGLDMQWKQLFKRALNKKTELVPADLNDIINLQSLDCSKVRGSSMVLKSLTPLKQLTKLKSIDFSNTEVADISALADMKQLESIDCRGTKVSNLQAIKGLENIKFLDCSNTNVQDISPLAGSAPRLQKLILAETKVSNLAPLAYASGLKYLDISGTRVGTLESLKDLKNLSVLMLSYSEVSSLIPVLEWTWLTQITLQGLSLKSPEIDAIKAKNPNCKITK